MDSRSPNSLKLRASAMSGASSMAGQVKNPPAIRRHRRRSSIPRSGQSLQEGVATHPVFLPGESHGLRSLVGYTESDTTEQLSTHILSDALLSGSGHTVRGMAVLTPQGSAQEGVP